MCARVYACCVYVDACVMSWHVCEGQRKTLWSQSPPSPLCWLWESNTGLQAYVASAFTCWVIWTTWNLILSVLKKVLLISVSYCFSVGTTLPARHLYHNVYWECCWQPMFWGKKYYWTCFKRQGSPPLQAALWAETIGPETVEWEIGYDAPKKPCKDWQYWISGSINLGFWLSVFYVLTSFKNVLTGERLLFPGLVPHPLL